VLEVGSVSTIGLSSQQDLGNQAQQASEQAVRDASPWIEGLGRFGYLAIGLVYGTVGVLAALAAMGKGGDTTDTHGALGWLLQAPFGRGILGTLAVGLAGYALWRMMQAVRDTEGKGTDLKGIWVRSVYAFIGLVYSGLALSAFRLAQSQGQTGGGGGDAMAQDWTAWLLMQPFGQILVAAVGLAVIGAAAVQFFMGFTKDWCDSLKTSEMSDLEQRVAIAAARVGYSARGIAFGIIGVLLLVAAMRARAEDVRGLGGALATLAAQPFGPWLLGAVAGGLVAYGVFKIVEARYRRFVLR
jgi:hypothetical protein